MSIPVYDLPALGFERISFDLIVPRSVNRMGGRRTEARRFGTPYWSASYQMIYQDERGTGQAEAWVRKLLTRGGVFKAYDLFRPRPVEAGDTPLTWTPHLTSITDGGQTASISGIGNDFQFREGDYVAFKMASDLVVSLHSIAVDVKANGSGVVSLTIDPPLDTQHFTASGATPIFEKPYCLMQPFDWSAPKSWSSRNPSFSAQEVFFYELPEAEDEEE